MAGTTIPDWVPEAVQAYLAHTSAGCSLRALAKQVGRHPSTLLRQVRRVENLRDDQLVDSALRRLATGFPHTATATDVNKDMPMTAQTTIPSDAKIEREARRILRRLAEPGACLALADGMENAVVVRDAADGQTVRTAVVERPVAEAMALRDWIVKSGGGKVLRYRITPAGRGALKRLLAQEESRRVGNPGSEFGEQHREYDYREVSEDGRRRRVRFNLAESPLLTLARRRDKDGVPFLSEDLVAAGERLREDFELAQMGTRVAQNWERFLTGGGDRGGFDAGTGPASGPTDARQRVQEALADLGPGLGDVAVRCCCFLEGLETAEKRMGWSARSGKIVLRIALQRLRQHYEEQAGRWSPLIG